MWEQAAILLAASRRAVPAPTLDLAIYEPIEEGCRSAIGNDGFEELAARGDAMPPTSSCTSLVQTTCNQTAVRSLRSASS